MTARPLLALTLFACDVDASPAPWLDTIDEVCAHLPDCSPVLPGGAWDWRTEATCRRTMTAGADPEACLAAVDALTCIGPGARPEVGARVRASRSRARRVVVG